MPPARSAPFSVLTPCESNAAWLPACFTRGSFAASTAQQRGVATASGGEPPSRDAPPDGTRAQGPTGPAADNQSASSADAKQRQSRPQNPTGKSASRPQSAGGKSAPLSGSAGHVARPQEPQQQGSSPLEVVVSQGSDGQQPRGDEASGDDRGDGGAARMSLVVPEGEMEGEIDELLDSWDPLMSEVCCNTLSGINEPVYPD